MSALATQRSDCGNSGEADLFAQLTADIREKGYSINPVSLSMPLAEELLAHLQQMSAGQFDQAGIGRDQRYIKNSFVRTDEVCWINGESAAGRDWLGWAARLQQYLNRHLFLGLFSFESHFAHYRPGDYYKRHVDAFKGEANRVLSVVIYLNHGWGPTDGGELVLYMNDRDRAGIKVTPAMATVVAFLSEEFLHEVLPANRDRYSIAGWYRVNTSILNKIDPPR